MIDNDLLEYAWAQKYRPKKVSDVILPDELKSLFEAYAEEGHVPSLLLAGASGTGKTTMARALCSQVGVDVLFLNASLNNGIDTLRTKIEQFASTISFTGVKKVVILDEADALTPNAQDALRAFIEAVSKNATFILTANHKNRIKPALAKSRFTVIDFKIKAADKPKLAAQFMKRTEAILEQEGIEFDKRILAETIQKHFPDFRATLNTLQKYSTFTGKIDSGILASFSEETFSDLIKSLKAKKFNDVRKWVAQNTDNDSGALFRGLYDAAFSHLESGSIPILILILAKYQYWDEFARDKELNMMAALVEIMRDVSWK